MKEKIGEMKFIYVPTYIDADIGNEKFVLKFSNQYIFI